MAEFTVRDLAGAGGKGPGGAEGAPQVLVIDDDSTVCAVTGRVLTSFGFRALTTTDAAEGVALFRTHARAIACTLLDVTMPGHSVEATLAAIRQVGPATPVILISGHDAAEVSRRFAEGTVAGVLQKPFDPETLRALLEDVLTG